MPYSDPYSNTLAVVAQYSILLTFFGAFIVESRAFVGHSHSFILGCVLVAAGLMIIVFSSYFGSVETFKRHKDQQVQTCIIKLNFIINYLY